MSLQPHPVAGVYFATCINTLFGAVDDGGAHHRDGVPGALAVICAAAGVSLVEPEGIEGLCCGTIWQSKGLVKGHKEMTSRVVRALWQATEQGRLPVVCDAASCSLELTELPEHLPEGSPDLDHAKKLVILDAVTFVRERLLGSLSVSHPLDSIAIHPTCSHNHLGMVDDVVAVAHKIARDVWVPPEAQCCGFAGGRGMLHPELTRAATATEASAIRKQERARAAAGLSPDGSFSAYVSGNRTCELGMSRATGHNFRHILEVLAEVID